MENYTIQNRSIATWLLTCCIFIFIMVWIGGVTRLTQSGLSITEWKPVSGVIPPFSETSWQEEFSKYQKSPEYLKKNLGMSLPEFKEIFWLEFIHRLVGRITGFVFLVPLIYFILKKQINRPLALRLCFIFALGGMQGFVGWFMVKSGLKEAPHVSQYWLAFHLAMALLIYGLVLSEGVKAFGSYAYSTIKPVLRKLSLTLVVVVFIQCLLGAFVAGTHAGLAYNTFPDMNGQFVPDGMLVMSPWYINFFENTTTIQFIHRVFAYFTALMIILFAIYSRKFNLTKGLQYVIAAGVLVVIIQICLGVLTLLMHVPVAIASAHQMFAMVLFTLTVVIKESLDSRF